MEKVSQEETKKINDFEEWAQLLDELCGLISRTMKLVPPRELTGESEKGINELVFKMVILSHLSTKYETLKIVSEREVEGGRIDLFVQNIKTQAILIIEVKYVRIGFIEKAVVNPKASHSKRFALYKAVDEEICRMDQLTLKSVVNRWYMKPNCPVKTENLNDIMQSALAQSRRYCGALLEGGVNPVKNKDIKIYYTAITGIGTRVVLQELIYFNK